MDRSKGFSAILIPSATVFVSSACIMIIELVAGRLIARHLGSSLYTWTSIIGVVLTGITIGNYLGGRIADRFPARKALASLFGLASVACVVIVILNNIVGEWILLWKFSWPLRAFSHVSLVFLIPSTLLGTISPVVAKMALDKGLPTGRTVGDIYAWGAAGSIAGTFLAGFYLIAAMGTIAIIWTIAAVLLLMGILYHAKLWPLYVWAVIFVILVILGLSPSAWAGDVGSSMLLRKKADPKILYENETQYCYVAVKQISNSPDQRAFIQDKLRHSEIIMDDIENLQYHYEQIHAAATYRFAGNKKKLSTLIIGGGGYVFPRYIEKIWPGSRVDVVEIDPGVTKAAVKAFGLDENTSINTFSMDARNYIDQLLIRENTGGEKVRYDFIYEDALNDYSIPSQLVTKEFNDKIATLLGEEGVYLIELIEIYNSGLFLGAYINTLQQTFKNVSVVTIAERPKTDRNTFVIAASNRELDLENLGNDYPKKQLDLWILGKADIDELRKKSGGLVMTDDYVPVENLLAPVVIQSASEMLGVKYLNQAKTLKEQGKWQESIETFSKLLQFKSLMSIKAYNEIGLIYASQGNLEQAIKAFEDAIKYHEQIQPDNNLIASIYMNAGVLMQSTGQKQTAIDYLQKAADKFSDELKNNPKEAPLWDRLGTTYAMMGDFANASEAFRQALKLDPSNPMSYDNLVAAMEKQGKFQEAAKVLENGIELASQTNNSNVLKWLTNRLEMLKRKHSL